MSTGLLRSLLDSHVLNPTPVGDETVRFYVAFDELFGNEETESALKGAALRGRRACVVGPSGAGKSSLIEWVLGTPDEGFAAIRIPVGVERDETISDPYAFAQHAVRTVSKYAEEAEFMSRTERTTVLRSTSDRIVKPSQATTQKWSFGLSTVLKGGLAKEITSYVETVDQERSGSQIVDALDYVIALLRDRGLVPIFVIDDSDTWLVVDGIKDRSQLVNAFFDRVLRMLAERDCGLVVAVHLDYLGMAGYKQSEGFLESTVRVPSIRDAKMLGELLLHRIQQCSDSADLHDAFDDEAVEELLGYYEGAAERSLRRVMQAAQTGVQLALEQEADTVSEEAVEAAISGWH